MIGFFVIGSVGLVAALVYVWARRPRRVERLTMLPGPRPTAAVMPDGAEPSTRAMVDVTPRGTSIKV